jgi:hypothetical protein
MFAIKQSILFCRITFLVWTGRVPGEVKEGGSPCKEEGETGEAAEELSELFF